MVSSRYRVCPRGVTRGTINNASGFCNIASFYGKVADSLVRGKATTNVSRFVIRSITAAPGRMGDVGRFVTGRITTSGKHFAKLNALRPSDRSVGKSIGRLVSLNLLNIGLRPSVRTFGVSSCHYLGVCRRYRTRKLGVLVRANSGHCSCSGPGHLLPVLRVCGGLAMVNTRFNN